MSDPLFRTVAATGHRPEQFTPTQTQWVRHVALPRILTRLRDVHGTQQVLTGMARGVDLWWADEALRQGIDVAAYLPFEQQTSSWVDPDDVAEWERVRAAASREVIARDRGNVYAFHARNDLLIADSDLLVGVHVDNPSSNGTASTMKKAEARQRFVLDVNATRQTITPSWGQATGRQ